MHSYPLVSSEGCTWRPLPTLYINTEPTLRLLANLEPFPSGSSELRRSAMDNRHDSETVRYTTNPSSRTLIFYASCMCTFLFLFLMVILYIVLFEVLSYISNLAIKCGTSRNKCAACFRQYNKVEHLVEHMRVSFHSVHEPKCGVCQKHCRFFESLREHLIGKRCLKLKAALIARHLYSKDQMISLLKDHCRRLNVPGYSELEDAIYASTSSKVQMLLELTVHHANSLALLRWVT